MSIHIQLTSEAQAELRSQKRISSLISGAISVLSLTFLALLLAYIFTHSTEIKDDPLKIYRGEVQVKDSPQSDPIRTSVPQKPSAPTSSVMTKAIVTIAPTDLSLPDSEVNAPEPSQELGDLLDFGVDWGNDDNLDSGSFFELEVSGKNMVFVIDYSASMRGPRDDLMREELAESLSSLSHRMNYALIFFAGPAWVAGDKFSLNQDEKGCVLETPSGETFKWESKSKFGFYESTGERRKVEWLSVNDENLKVSRRSIRNTPLAPGTNWLWPLEMALTMDPAPDVINFMTDGSMRNVGKIIPKITNLAKQNGTKINCVALMEPKAKRGMMKLARETGGQFLMVDKNGSKSIVSFDEAE